MHNSSPNRRRVLRAAGLGRFWAAELRVERGPGEAEVGRQKRKINRVLREVWKFSGK